MISALQTDHFLVFDVFVEIDPSSLNGQNDGVPMGTARWSRQIAGNRWRGKCWQGRDEVEVFGDVSRLNGE